MIYRTKLLSALLGLSLALHGCNSDPRGTERWATTEDTNVAINWDKVNEAYKAAEGPEDFERRINEIYEGSEVISVAVQDDESRGQIVTGFFDKNSSGSVDEGEKIFTIKREITGEGQGQYQTMGHGHYAGYSSPFLGLASGMLMGAMISNMFAPSYVPMYSRPYTTSAGRMGDLRNQRTGYRAQNPSRFSKPSQSGRSYGGSKSGSGGGFRSRGGSRFGVQRARASLHLA